MKPVNTPTTAQRFGALLKSARDTMRKDKGLNGDLDRLPLLTWVMFLKFLDDVEHQILTNPPFGGEEERGILGNFPEDKRTAETALLFLQLIMRKLRRGPKPGRAGGGVPNGTLFGDGVCARIKED